MKFSLVPALLALSQSAIVLASPLNILHRLAARASPSDGPPPGCVISYATPFELQIASVVAATAKVKRDDGWG